MARHSKPLCPTCGKLMTLRGSVDDDYGNTTYEYICNNDEGYQDKDGNRKNCTFNGTVDIPDNS